MRAALLAAVLCATDAWAYRPFDGTDATTAEPEHVELEVGPLGFLHGGDGDTLFVPALIFNLGLQPGYELVVAVRNELPLHGGWRDRITDTGAFVKHVLRDGVLQGETGLSVATEVGVLLPTFQDEPGIGASGALIASYAWQPLALHLNLEGHLERGDHPFTVFTSLIAEGPRTWRVRPVAELLVKTGSLLASALVGVIWPLSEAMTFDAAVRVDSTPAVELRVGFTWVIDVASKRHELH